MTQADNNEKVEQAFLPLKELLISIRDLHDILFVYRFSAKVCMTPFVFNKVKKHGVQALAHEEDDLPEMYKEDKRHVEEGLRLLVNQNNSQFSFLFAQASINLYTYLEAAIKSFVLTYFKIDSGIYEIKQISSIKVPFGEFKILSDEEQMEYLFEQYEKQIGAGLKYGINRFESLLEPIGFSGQVTALVSDGIYELAQVRNCLLHRNGVIDKKLVDSCPWFKPYHGKKLIISPETFEKYTDAAMDYIKILNDRIAQKDFSKL